ncbi:MAG: Cytidylate kinase [Candidatus Eremiobacteraeota bacterium]|nr:Cytidylate kinase [Candidatus Eremiobacteraeota bacterium]
MIVSIARELGAGGRSVGEAVASAMGATLLDERSIITELSARAGFAPEFLAERMERPPSAGDRLIADLAASSAMMWFVAPAEQPDEIIITTVREIVMEHAGRGDVVVIGHGGRSMLGWRPAGVRVLAILLHASRAWRIEQLARRYAIDSEEARKRIERSDDARKRFQQHYFNTDLYDSRQYDLVLSAESLGLPLTIEIATLAATSVAP